MIGLPERTTDEIKTQFANDMGAYRTETKSGDANGQPLFDPSTLYYHNLLAGMNQVIQDRSNEVIRLSTSLANLETQFKNVSKMNNEALATVNTDHAKLAADVKKSIEAFNGGLSSTYTEHKQLVNKLTAIQGTVNQKVSQAEEAQKQAKIQVQKYQKEAADAIDTVKKLDRQQMDVPSGEVTWVSLPSKMVWINRGRADGLQRQTKFTVYSAESANTAKAVKKGSVEVTAIDGDHSAQCRILDDKLADPIMAGDKVFTPLWSPGQQNHFALTGAMDLDGDGNNQLNVVRGLINEGGGVVDCWLDASGQKHGQITAETSYLVLGAADKGSATFIKNHGEILNDATRYHLQTLKLSDFKQKMDYHKASSIEHFGNGTTTSGNVGRASINPTPAPAPKPAPAAAPSTP